MRSTGRVEITKNNIIYQRGKAYPLEKKILVGKGYHHLFQLYLEDSEKNKYPTPGLVAKQSSVGYKFAKKVMDEINLLGDIVDPAVIRAFYTLNNAPHYKMKIEHRIFLMSLHASIPNRPNSSYVSELLNHYGLKVCESSITNFFKSKFFQFKGTFGVPNNVPLDKFRDQNILRFYKFQEIIQKIENKHIIHWLDEKHIVNSDCVPKKVRRNPIFGYMPAIMVSGDFREAYNIFACISANPLKQHPIAYNIQKDNGSAVSFVAFIKSMIVSRFLSHNELLIMDNAAIHTGGEADIVEGLLWDTIVDGKPLNILVVYLPTRSPELNPIELVFHILSLRVCSFKYTEKHKATYGTDKSQMVVKVATDVMDEMTYATVRNCINKCGYDV